MEYVVKGRIFIQANSERPSLRLLRFLCGAAYLVLGVSLMGSPVHAATTAPSPVVFAGSIREVPASTQPAMANPHKPSISRATLRPGELAAAMDFEVALKMRDFAELQSRLAHGERVSAAEMTAKYNPSQADYDAVKGWLVRSGFQITRQDGNHLAIFARGRTSLVRDALQVRLARVTLEGVEYTSAITAPSVPANVAPLLLGVNGLQPHLRMHKHLVRHDSLTGTNAPYLPSQIAEAYKANGLYNSGVTGSGQTIAIAIDTFPATSDLTSFWQTYGVSQSINNITFIQVVSGPLPSPEGEETLDTEWCSSIAPRGQGPGLCRANPSLSTALDQTYQQIYSDVTTHPEYGIHQMSMSYGIGETYTTATQVQTDDQYFAELAAAGVTVFCLLRRWRFHSGSRPRRRRKRAGPGCLPGERSQRDQRGRHVVDSEFKWSGEQRSDLE